MFEPAVAEKWLGMSTDVRPRSRTRAVLAYPDGEVAVGRVESVGAQSGRRELLISWGRGAANERLSLSVAPRGEHCRLRVRIAGALDEDAAAIRREFWEKASRKLARVVRDAVARRSDLKQAVIVIHGIGEQKPGEVLAELSRALYPDQMCKKDRHAPRTSWVKPDYGSALFEMRKMKIKPTVDTPALPSTDVFELYWAHLIQDTTADQVSAWVRNLLVRRPSTVPRRLRWHFVAAWAVVLVIGAIALVLLTAPIWNAALAELTPIVVALAVLGVTATVVRGVARRGLISHLGDAARYLEPKPANIARRQEIREAGVNLLERLHASGDYDRIVLVGHSLGSVIAYDILTFAWMRMHGQHLRPPHTKSSALHAVERYMREPPPDDEEERKKFVERAQELQFAAWQEHRANTQPWLVTDLITLGSPLTYADILLASSREHLCGMTAERILPTAPPEGEHVKQRDGDAVRISYESQYRSRAGGRPTTIVLPHHAAPFAVTRWTNLYFKFSGIARGDPIGGPLNGLFGHSVGVRLAG